ncbi:hypothetical protein ACFX15_039665 [Malus domestica]
MADLMKKTFYYNFYPTKEEELEEAVKGGSSGDVPRVLVEIADIHYQPPPPLIISDPRHIVRAISASEVKTGVLFLPFKEAFEHVFRHWSMEEANIVVNGCNKFPVTVWDVTDYNLRPPMVYGKDHGIYFQKGHMDEYYVLACVNVISNRRIKVGDEIGLAWDRSNGLMPGKFLFKLLSRADGAKKGCSLSLG